MYYMISIIKFINMCKCWLTKTIINGLYGETIQMSYRIVIDFSNFEVIYMVKI